MNTPVLVLLIAVCSVKCGVYEMDSQEQHNGIQTPFLPVAPMHYLQSNSENLQLFHVTSQPAVQPSTNYNQQTSFPQAPYPPSYYPTAAPSATSAHFSDAPVSNAPVSNALNPMQEHSIEQSVQPVLPAPMVSVHKTIVKYVEVPYPVDKYVKVDRHVKYPVNRYYRVDRPYEVIKHVEKPYVVKVERKVPVQIISKIPVPKPIVQVEPIFTKPQHIHAHQLQFYKYKH